MIRNARSGIYYKQN